MFLLKVHTVNVCNFQLAARRGLDVGCNVTHLLVVKIQTSHGVVALWIFGFFFNAQGFLLRIKVHHTIALWVLHMVSKDTGTGGLRIGPLHELDQIVTIKNVVAQHQSARVLTHKFFANDEGLGQTIGARLHGILDVHTPLTAVSQQVGKTRGVLRCTDQQHISDARQHEGSEGVIHHGLVVHRHELLGHRLRHRIKTGARPARQDNAFASVHGHNFAMLLWL